MNQKAIAVFIIAALIGGMAIGYGAMYISGGAEVSNLRNQIATKENQIATLNQRIQNLTTQGDQKNSQISVLQQQVNQLNSQVANLTQQTGGQNITGIYYAYILSSEAGERLKITSEYKYISGFGSCLVFTIKNIGTETLVAKQNKSSGNYYDYFAALVYAKDSSGKTVGSSIDFWIGRARTLSQYDISSLQPQEEVTRRIPVANPSMNNVKSYETRINYIAG